MPKVYLSEKDRRVAQLSRYIFGEITAAGKTQTEVAMQLGITQQTFCTKVKKGTLTFVELWKVFRYLGTENEMIIKLIG